MNAPLYFDDFVNRDSQYEIAWGSGYRLAESELSHQLGEALSARQLDLLDIAMAAYAADRLNRRRPHRARGDHWHRQLEVKIAVRDLAFWTSAQTQEALYRLLHWLTDDEWKVEFVSGRWLFRSDVGQLTLFRRDLRKPVQVRLFSGGLDSFAGAARDLEQSEGDLVLVSASTSTHMAALQRKTAALLSPLTVTGEPPRLIQIGAGLRASTARQVVGAREAPERTQRTRGLVFLAFGAIGAMVADVDELRVYENGVGAMNLPLTEAQFGAHNTRAMRPETLLYASELFSLLHDEPFVVVNPSFTLTKSRLCEELPAEVRAALNATVSCDTGLVHRTNSTHLCGECTSCLLRRQTLHAAGLSALDQSELSEYRLDVLDVLDPADKHVRNLHYMLDQAARIDLALSEPDPSRALLRSFPDLRTIHRALGQQGLTDATGLTRRLLSTYVDEWRAFPHPLVQRYLQTPVHGFNDPWQAAA